MHRIAFLTCSDLSRYFPDSVEPLLTHDDRMAADWLRKRGYQVFAHDWHSLESVDADCVIIRSTWDYCQDRAHVELFREWVNRARSTGILLYNEPELIEWNLNKRYLEAIGALGLNIVPSIFLTSPVLPQHLPWPGPYVVKPLISAAARLTYQYENVEELRSAIEGVTYSEVFRWQGVIIQPFLEEVIYNGEWSLVFFGDQYSHAVKKIPKDKSWYVQDELGGRVLFDSPPSRIVEFAKEQMSRLIRSLPLLTNMLYARLDLIDSKVYGPVIGEIEMIEPELFFRSPHSQGFLVNEHAMNLFEHRLIELLQK